jgi:hypothetical protein
MAKLFLDCKLEYGKTITVRFRMEGDGMIGDGWADIEPNSSYLNKAYEEIYSELKDKGYIEVN